MTTLREAATHALEAMEGGADSWQLVGPAIDALKAALAEPVLQTCNCRWDGEVQVQQCTLHEAHVDAIKEWAQRAKFAEKKLAALAEPVLNPAPGYCKHCKQYTIEEPLPAEPVQEQPVCDECGKSKCDGWALYCVKCVEPMFGLQRPAESVQEPGDFDHGIGADRFKVVRGAFWWHVLIGDSPTKHGKFHSRASAEKMAADLLREFRNGAFVQHEAALAEPQIWVCPEAADTHRYDKPGHCEDCGKTLVQIK